MTSGNGHSAILTFRSPPQRIVSLVPSMTESLFDLGIGEKVVGVTDYCQPPEAALDGLARVGGTKSPDLRAIVELTPDLVIANKEENTRQAVEALEGEGLNVWVTFPRSVEESISLLWGLIRLFRARQAAARIKTLELTLEWTVRATSQRPPVRVFCPVWQSEAPDSGMWWMTFNHETYAHDLLACCGAENVFGDRVRRYPLAADLGRAEAESPGERDTRYPRVTSQEVILASPEVILLPSEPYAFNDKEAEVIRQHLADTPAVRAGRVYMLDGSLITWHGTRLARALAEIPAYLEAGEADGGDRPA
jgi:ABC-type Fe3+-hydroxamate transport system substrate-binding protein